MTQYKIIQGRMNLVDHSITLGNKYNMLILKKNESNTKSANKTIVPIINYFIITPPLFYS